MPEQPPMLTSGAALREGLSFFAKVPYIDRVAHYCVNTLRILYTAHVAPHETHCSDTPQ